MVGPVDPESVPSIFPDQNSMLQFGTPLPVPVSDAGSLGRSSIPDNLVVNAQQLISLPEGRMPLIQWIETIKKFIQELKEMLERAEYVDDAIYALLRGDAAGVSASLINDSQVLAGQIGQWNIDIGLIGKDLITSYAAYEAAVNSYNTRVSNMVANDIANVQHFNSAEFGWNNIHTWATSPGILALGFASPIFNDQGQLVGYNVDYEAAYHWIEENYFANYNLYVTFGRADGFQALNDLNAASGVYAGVVVQANATIAGINAQRAAQGLPPVIPSSLSPPSPLDPNLNNVLGYALGIRNPPRGFPFGPPAPLVLIPVPNPPNGGRITIPPEQQPPGRAIYHEDLQRVVANSTMVNGFVKILANAMALAEAYRDLVNIEFRNFGVNIVLPSFAAKTGKSVVADSSTSTGGIGLASYTLGLESKNLEIALSNSMFKEIVERTGLPINAQEFALTQFGILDLVSKSSLMSSLPAVSLIAPSMGILGIPSAAVQIAASLASLDGILGAIGSGSIDQVVNGVLHDQVQTGRQNGDQKLGNLTVGEIGSIAGSLSAASKISVLGLGLAQLGRTLGIPDLVAQVFGNTGVPGSDVLALLTAGTSIAGVLGNPISAIFISQALVKELVEKQGFSPQEAIGLVNTLLGELATKGEGAVLGELHALASEELQKSGFALFDAELLANEVVALIRGELGTLPLNVQFGLNSDPSVIASSVANFINGQDVGLVGILLNSARIISDKMIEIVRSAGDDKELQLARLMEDIIKRTIKQKDYDTQREFRDALVDNFISGGFERNVASFLSNSVATYGLNGSNVSIFGVSAARLGAIDDETEHQLSAGFGDRAEESRAILDEAKKEAIRRGPISSEDELRLVLQEEIQRAASKRGLEVDKDIVNRAIAEIAPPGTLQTLPQLFENVSVNLVNQLRPEVGVAAAEKIKDKVLETVFGTKDINVVDKEDHRAPLSLLNQVRGQVKKLIDNEEEELTKKAIKKLIELLESLITPNATLGFTMQNLGGPPDALLKSFSMMGSSTKPIVDIPA